MFQTNLHFEDLVNIKDWQNIQDSFSEAFDVTLRTFSPEGNPLSEASRPTRLCKDILSKPSKDHDLCTKCLLDDTIPNIKDIKKDLNIKCHFDLDAFVVPIRAAGDMIVAYLIVGPMILKRRKDVSEYSKEAKKLGIKLDDLADALIEINVFSYNKIDAIIKLLKQIFSYTAETGYHKKRLGEIRPEVVELDPLFSRYYEEKILGSLLNSCTLALGADSGSVMTLDKKTNMLHIKVASKLNDEIVNNTNIKVGEGIAGLAAQISQPIILPKDENKNGLSGRMRRKYIKSSMIVPFNKGNTHDLYGVININMVRKNIDFSEKDIALVKELVNMAGSGPIPLHQPTPGP